MDFRVYISSTTIDLLAFRKEVFKALRKAGVNPVGMEDYAAEDALPVKKCLEDVVSCDVYVGIFAWRYGYIPPGYDQSITELEYRKAEECNIPALIFLLDDSISWPDEYCDTGEKGEKIKQLRSKFEKEKVIGWYCNPHHLASEVQSAVNKQHMQMVLGRRYAEVNTPTTKEQSVSLNQSIDLLQNMMKQKSQNYLHNEREAVPQPVPRLQGYFVNRKNELNQLQSCLINGSERLIMILAPGGYGKTELVSRLLQDVLADVGKDESNVQGILYLKCAGGNLNAGRIFTEAGRVAGKQKEFNSIYADKNTQLDKKLYYFFSELSQTGNVWLILDNFEELLDSGNDTILDPELKAFLETASDIEHRVRIILISRAVPRFKGNRRAEKIELNTGLSEKDSIKYLRKEGLEFGLMEEDEKVLREFVKRVHGIPKALESAIGYLEDHYPAIRFQDMLKDEKVFVDFDKHDLENGLKSLVLQQFNKLSADARLVLSALSVFPKPVHETAIRYLLPAIDKSNFAKIIARLFKNRLIRENSGFYDLHPVVRPCVYNQLQAGDPVTSTDKKTYNVYSDNEARNKKGRYLKSLTRTMLHYKASEFYKKLCKPEEEWKTIEDIEPQLQEFYHLIQAGSYEQAADLLDKMDVDYLQPWGYANLVVKMRKQLLGKLKKETFIAANLGNLGHVLLDTPGKISEAIVYYEKALEIEYKAGNTHRAGSWLNGLGIASYALGKSRKAIRYYDDALKIAQQTGNKRGEGSILGNLGNVYSELGELQKGIYYYEKALALARELRNRIAEGSILDNLGVAWSDLGETNKALEYFDAALKIAEETGNKSGEGRLLVNMGQTRIMLGEYEKALELFNKALEIARELDFRLLEGYLYKSLGAVYFKLNDYEKSGQYIEKGLSIARQAERTGLIAELLHFTGILHHYRGKTNNAVNSCLESLSLNMPETNYSSAILLGIINLQSGNKEKAREYLAKGIDLCNKGLKRTNSLYDRLYKLALAHLANNEPDTSLEIYKKAVNTCSDSGVVQQALQDVAQLKDVPDIKGVYRINKLLNDALKNRIKIS